MDSRRNRLSTLLRTLNGGTGCHHNCTGTTCGKPRTPCEQALSKRTATLSSRRTSSGTATATCTATCGSSTATCAAAASNARAEVDRARSGTADSSTSEHCASTSSRTDSGDDEAHHSGQSKKRRDHEDQAGDEVGHSLPIVAVDLAGRTENLKRGGVD